MAVSTGSFVEEIYDQFLVCRMCSEIYKTPKVLNCMHTFCEKCLETHYEMEEQERPYRFLLYTRALTCPLCHSRTELPTGGVHRLPDNFLVANLADVVNRRKPSAKNPVCEICRTGTRNEADKEAEEDKRAVVKCLDCVKMLCRSCADLHRRTRVTQQHGLFDIQVEKDTECKLHPNEVIRFYCDPCEECICVLCTFHDHKDHDVSSLIEALDRHRGPFEELIGRCGDRVERLKEQVELIDRCERELRLAEEHIRDSAIESIAAIRRREKDLLAELRETLGEQTLGFIAEKDTFKENLKNLEGTFQLTNAMLKGTSIDLLMVKKEMKDKLTVILDTSVKKTPETLKRNIQLCHEDYYQDICSSAFNHMEQTDRFISQKTKSGDNEAVKRTVAVRSVGTEIDLPVSLPSFPTTGDFVDFNHKRDFSNGLTKTADISQSRMGRTANGEEDQSYSTDDDDDDDDSSEMQQNSGWQRPMAVVVVTEIPRTLGNIVLRPVSGGPRQADRTTQTRQTVTTERFTSMPKILFSDKETSTPHVHVLHKNVSTDNQTMVEKSTSTVVDVTAAYRGAATTKRMVMVSRGTCTPRMMMLDKETLPIPSSSANRGCSPVAWSSSTDNTHVSNSRMEDGLPVLAISEHHLTAQNNSVRAAGEDSTHIKSSLATTVNIVSNEGSTANRPTQIPEVLKEDGTAANQKSAASHGGHVAVLAGQMPHQIPVAVLGDIATSQGHETVPNSQLSNQSILKDQVGTAAAKKSQMASLGIQVPVQRPVASIGGNAGTHSPVALPKGQVPVHRSAAVPLSNVANQVQSATPAGQAPTQTPTTVLGDRVHGQSLVAISEGQIAAQRPMDIPASSDLSHASLAVSSHQAPTKNPATVPIAIVGNQSPLSVSGCQAPVQRSMTVPGCNVINQSHGASPGSQIPTSRPMAVPGSNVVNHGPVASPGSQVPASRPITVPGSNVANPMATPANQMSASRPMAVPGSSFANQSPVASLGSQIPAPKPVTAPVSNVLNQIPLMIPGGIAPARAPITMIAGYVPNQSQVTVPGGNIATQGQLTTAVIQTPSQTDATVSGSTGFNQSPATNPGSQTPKQKPLAVPTGDIAKQGLKAGPVNQMAVQKPLAVPGVNDPKQSISTNMEGKSPNDKLVVVAGGNTGNEVHSQRPAASRQGQAPNQRVIGNTFSQNPIAIQESSDFIIRSVEFPGSNHSSQCSSEVRDVTAPASGHANKPEETTAAGNLSSKSGAPMSTKGNGVSNADGDQPQKPMISPLGQASVQGPIVNSSIVAPNVLGQTVSTLLSAIFPSTAAKQVSNVQGPEHQK